MVRKRVNTANVNSSSERRITSCSGTGQAHPGGMLGGKSRTQINASEIDALIGNNERYYSCHDRTRTYEGNTRKSSGTAIQYGNTPTDWTCTCSWSRIPSIGCPPFDQTLQRLGGHLIADQRSGPETATRQDKTRRDKIRPDQTRRRFKTKTRPKCMLYSSCAGRRRSSLNFCMARRRPPLAG